MPAGTAAADVEAKLKREYGKNKGAIYGTMNKIGLMRGNKVTAKGMKKPRRMMFQPHRPPKTTVMT